MRTARRTPRTTRPPPRPARGPRAPPPAGRAPVHPPPPLRRALARGREPLPGLVLHRVADPDAEARVDPRPRVQAVQRLAGPLGERLGDRPRPHADVSALLLETGVERGQEIGAAPRIPPPSVLSAQKKDDQPPP